MQVASLHGPFEFDVGARLLLGKGPQIEAIACCPGLLDRPDFSIRGIAAALGHRGGGLPLFCVRHLVGDRAVRDDGSIEKTDDCQWSATASHSMDLVLSSSTSRFRLRGLQTGCSHDANETLGAARTRLELQTWVLASTNTAPRLEGCCYGLLTAFVSRATASRDSMSWPCLGVLHNSFFHFASFLSGIFVADLSKPVYQTIG